MDTNEQRQAFAALEDRVAELINANNELARLVTDLRAALAAAERERDDANIEAQENVIIALGLNPSDFKGDLMEHVISCVIGAMTQRLAELEEAQQWRPVTEEWPHYHDRVVIAHWGGTWAQFARRVQSDDGEDEWLLDDGRKFDFESASVALLTSPPPLPH